MQCNDPIESTSHYQLQLDRLRTAVYKNLVQRARVTHYALKVVQVVLTAADGPFVQAGCGHLRRGMHTSRCSTGSSSMGGGLWRWRWLLSSLPLIPRPRGNRRVLRSSLVGPVVRRVRIQIQVPHGKLNFRCNL